MRLKSLFVTIFFFVLVAGCENEQASNVSSLDAGTQQNLDDAQSAMEAGSFGMALMFADSAIAKQPRVADTHFMRGQVLLKAQRFEDAKEALNRVIQLNADYPSAWFNLGNVAFIERQYSEAIDAYDQEAAVTERQKERYGESFNVRYAETMSRLALQKGRAYRQLGRADESVAAFQQAIMFESVNADAHADLSQALMDAGDLQNALVHAEHARNLVPAHPDYNYLAGSLKRELGQTENAISDLQMSLQAKPWLSQARYNLGLALIDAGQTEAGELQLQLADTLQVLNDRIEKAKLNAQTFPREVERWLMLGKLYIQAGRVDEAVEPFAVAESLRPDDLAIKNDQANLALVRGDTLSAIRRLEQVLSISPTFADGWYNLGVIHALRKNYDDARKAWQQTLQHDPAHKQAQISLETLASL